MESEMKNDDVKVIIHCGDYLDDTLAVMKWVLDRDKDLHVGDYSYLTVYDILKNLWADENGRIRTFREDGSGFRKIQIFLPKEFIPYLKKAFNFEIEVEDNDRTNHKEEQNPGTAELGTAPEA